MANLRFSVVRKAATTQELIVDLSIDPLEQTIAEALDAAGIAYKRERDNDACLDFLLENGVYIEVKAWHTPRISDQMSRARNVIAVQGPDAVEWLAQLITNSR